AAEDDRPLAVAFRDAKADDCGAEDMSRVEKCRRDTGRDLDLCPVIETMKECQRGVRVLDGVERVAERRDRGGLGISSRGGWVFAARGRELGRGLFVLGRSAIGVALGEALVALRELLLELGRIQQDQSSEID